MRLPKDLRFIVLGGLAAVVVAFGLSLFLLWPAAAPPPPAKGQPVARPLPHKDKAAYVAVPLPAPPVKDPRFIDPGIQQLADDLASKEQSPARDLEIVNEFITLYSRAFQGNPIGLNEDITAVLTGHNPRKGVLFPPANPMVVNGQLVDRWGTPYWFHPYTSTQMEIRSAGPDKNLFTPDDIVLNAGPDDVNGTLGMAR